MQCFYPTEKVVSGFAHILPCGRCKACKVNRREEWASRIILEAMDHPASLFVTLTYNQESLPPDGSLSKRDAQLWLKRLRKSLSPKKIRYFLCGEYGSRTERPHYHAVVFGLTTEHSEEIEQSWPHGFVTSATLTPERARYTARYVIKKPTSGRSYGDGRTPEFSTMSRRPGLGKNTLQRIARRMMAAGSQTIPETMSYGSFRLRLDPYCRKVLLDELTDEGKTLIQFSKFSRSDRDAKTRPIETISERASRLAAHEARDIKYILSNEKI